MQSFQEAREAKGWTVGQLASEAGVKPRIVDLVESNVGAVRLHLISNVADALQLSQAERWRMMTDQLVADRLAVAAAEEAVL